MAKFIKPCNIIELYTVELTKNIEKATAQKKKDIKNTLILLYIICERREE